MTTSCKPREKEPYSHTGVLYLQQETWEDGDVLSEHSVTLSHWSSARLIFQSNQAASVAGGAGPGDRCRLRYTAGLETWTGLFLLKWLVY